MEPRRRRDRAACLRERPYGRGARVGGHVASRAGRDTAPVRARIQSASGPRVAACRRRGLDCRARQRAAAPANARLATLALSAWTRAPSRATGFRSRAGPLALAPPRPLQLARVSRRCHVGRDGTNHYRPIALSCLARRRATAGAGALLMPGRAIFIALLSLYLFSGGGKGYSIDG